MLEEFKKFALRGNVVDLAIGVIIGAALFRHREFAGRRRHHADHRGGHRRYRFFELLRPAVVEGYGYDARRGKKRRRGIGLGNFLTITLNFIIIAFVLFLVIRAINQFSRKEAEKAPTPTKTEELLTEIRDQLKSR